MEEKIAPSFKDYAIATIFACGVALFLVDASSRLEERIVEFEVRQALVSVEPTPVAK